MPTFSEEAVVPACSRCGYPARTLVQEARDLVRDAHGREDNERLSMRLSATVGNFQTALLEGDRKSARAFLANIVALGEMLLSREDR